MGAYLAFDLRRTRSKGNFRRVIPFVMGIGAIHIKGTWGTPDDDGVQTIKAKLRREQTERRKIPSPVYEQHYDAWNQRNIEATIEITRKVDKERGLVLWFRNRLEGKLVAREDATPPPGADGRGGGRGGGRGRGPGGGRGPRGGRGGGMGGGSSSFRVEETWTLESVKENRYPGFRARVAAAIKSGDEFVKAAIKNPNSGDLDPRNERAGRMGQRSYNSGRLACFKQKLKYYIFLSGSDG